MLRQNMRAYFSENIHNYMESILVKNSGYIKLKKYDDGPDGSLSIVEQLRDIPFKIKRVYYINKLKNRKSIRGHHAHKKLQQIIFCINGSFILSLDDGEKKQHLIIKNDSTGILIGPGLWHTMSQFSNDCVLLVLASDYFKESDYIRNYENFLKWLRIK
tara:strand:+ start:709 stop:1185 length:477 start_codon:yes stop_codon:yes gene_type:complete